MAQPEDLVPRRFKDGRWQVRLFDLSARPRSGQGNLFRHAFAGFDGFAIRRLTQSQVRDGADLLQQGELIPLSPALDYFPVCNSGDVHLGDRHRFACGR
jgi:hypothetical protein